MVTMEPLPPQGSLNLEKFFTEPLLLPGISLPFSWKLLLPGMPSPTSFVLQLREGSMCAERP